MAVADSDGAASWTAVLPVCLAQHVGDVAARFAMGCPGVHASGLGELVDVKIRIEIGKYLGSHPHYVQANLICLCGGELPLALIGVRRAVVPGAIGAPRCIGPVVIAYFRSEGACQTAECHYSSP
jgi:hypothetical protein